MQYRKATTRGALARPQGRTLRTPTRPYSYKSSYYDKKKAAPKSKPRKATASKYKTKKTIQALRKSIKAKPSTSKSKPTTLRKKLKSAASSSSRKIGKKMEMMALKKMKDMGSKVGKLIKQKGTQLALEAIFKHAVK